MASTGSGGASRTRRAVLKALALAPAAALGAGEAAATDYASAADVFAAVDRLAAEVVERLRALGEALPAARAFTSSLLADLARQEHDRARLRLRLRLAPAAPVAAAGIEEPRSLEALRASQEALMYAHAEGLPAIPDPYAVDALAKHMVDLSRHLTVTTLWIEAENERG